MGNRNGKEGADLRNTMKKDACTETLHGKMYGRHLIFTGNGEKSEGFLETRWTEGLSKGEPGKSHQKQKYMTLLCAQVSVDSLGRCP